MIGLRKNIALSDYLLLAIIITLAAAIRLTSLSYSYWHPDEEISVSVTQMISEQKTFDTNWLNADLPNHFKYPQYNFSGYLLSSSGVLHLARLVPISNEYSALEALRAWSGILGILTVFFIFMLGRQFFGVAVGLCAALLGAIAPLLYQDSLYARPETFVTALTLFCVYITGIRAASPARYLFAAAFVFGVLVATKVSMLALLPFLLLPTQKPAQSGAGLFDELVHYVKVCFHALPRRLPIILLGAASGFLIAAPYAVLNADHFAAGVLALSSQYSIGHWPHGLGDGSFVDRIIYSAQYFTSTSGTLILLFCAVGALWVLHERKFRLFFVILFVLIFAIRFGSYATFFERNFSHILPFVLIFSAYGLLRTVHVLRASLGAKRVVLLAALVVIALPSVKTTLNLMLIELPGNQASRLAGIRASVEARFGVQATQISWTADYPGLRKQITVECGPTLLEFPSAGDKYSADALRQLKTENGYSEVGRYNSIFSNVPPSTLHTYFTHTKIFLFKNFEDVACKNDRTASSSASPIS
ncbi:hypothetical protein EKL30_09845 [Candidimonas sp. SYP-B2681]|nr:glycosyltransferase family 39 protein [Candidimonas sp. SYP-B2681]RTZ43178.1 hypothetical protein EKL30_09845 [Candidimonas sp. SYP-B2681]